MAASACRVRQACSGDRSAELPSGVTEITRRGITMSIQQACSRGIHRHQGSRRLYCARTCTAWKGSRRQPGRRTCARRATTFEADVPDLHRAAGPGLMNDLAPAPWLSTSMLPKREKSRPFASVVIPGPTRSLTSVAKDRRGSTGWDHPRHRGAVQRLRHAVRRHSGGGVARCARWSTSWETRRPWPSSSMPM